MPLISISGRRPKNLGVREGRLAPCPSTPNCVCSDCEGKRHGIPPLDLAGRSPEEAWSAVKMIVGSLPRTEIITCSEGYLHVECRSRLCGFVDDLELHLRPEEGVIAVRCAARLGYSDFGANRRRIGTLRAAFDDGSLPSLREVDGSENRPG